MASSINPNNIATDYPVAGQDNDSQGFRDNFTNIKTNFEYAEAEIEDLQGKVLLKSALTGTTLDNDLEGAVISNPKLQGVRYTKANTATAAGNVTIDFSSANYHRIGQITGNVNLGFTNVPSAGNYSEFIVELDTPSNAYTVTMPTAVSIGNTKVQGVNANNVITYGEAGTYGLKFSTQDGGANYAVEELYRETESLTVTTEEINDTAAISTRFGAGFIDTSVAVETATLAAGTEGQIKMFAMTSDGGGEMRITVTNAAWGGLNRIILNDVGDGCTLLYTNSKWVCVGNNGCGFA